MENDEVFFEGGVIFPQVTVNGLSLSEFSDRLREQQDEDQDESATPPEE